MMRTAALLFGLVAGVSHDEGAVYVGELLAVSHESLELSRNEAITYIGFVGDPSALAGLGDLKVGDEVRAVFGSAPSPDGGGPINKILSIRRCEKGDAQCASDGKVQDAMEAERAKALARSQAQLERCNRKMEKTLLDDPRFAATRKRLSGTQSEELSRQANALTGKRKECATSVMNEHQKAVFEACELHHCGDQVGGGCSRIAGYSLSDAVLERALTDCKDVTSASGR